MKPTINQLYLLHLLKHGWKFKRKTTNKGFWGTYWSLVRRGWIDNDIDPDFITPDGLTILRQYQHKLPPQFRRYK